MVATGPSAAGKTTWVRTYFRTNALVEQPITERAPQGSTAPLEAARFWSKVNERRWRLALELEARTGLAVCDGDPFKLDYIWCKWRIGEATAQEWRAQLTQSRIAFAERTLGVADLIYCVVPSVAELRRRKEADTSRRRRNYDLHVRLAAPLREWYQAAERAWPARVKWGLPDNPADVDLDVGIRHDRSEPQLLDALIAELPAT